MRRGYLLARAAVAVLAACAWTAATAADDNKARNEQGAQGPEQGRVASLAARDREYMGKLAQAGLAEVELGKLAQEKASDRRVREFAAHMVRDHGKANEELMRIARAKGVELPDKPASAHQRKLKELEGLSGEEFDRKYITDAGIKDHEQALRLFEETARSARDKDLRQFASRTLANVREHLKLAQQEHVALMSTGGRKGGEDRPAAAAAPRPKVG